MPHESWQVLARLDWQARDGERSGRPDYGHRTAADGEWRRVTLEAPALEGASAVEIQLRLQNAPGGTVFWDELSLEEIAAPGAREVVVAAVNLRPRESASPQESVRAFVDLARAEVPAEADVIVLPEGITLVGTGRSYAEVAEPVPGRTTRVLGELARARDAWVVAGLYEREGVAIYNTAVLLDRQGRLAGAYRKVYLPREEVEGGLTPGDEYPVFTTDFGRVGLMICWDAQYADPARALALGGAELVLVPIWGGNETLVRAPHADDNAIRLHKVVDRGAFFEELRIVGHGDVAAGLLLQPGEYLSIGADRDRALDDDNRPVLQMFGDGVGDGH